MGKFQLSVDQFPERLKSRLEELQSLEAILKQNQKHFPQGRLRLGKSNGCVQYFHVASSEQPRGVYIERDNLQLAKDLAQKEYEKLLLANVHEMIALLQSLEKRYAPEKVDLLYESLHPERRRLVTPILLPEEMFVNQWLSVPYEKMPFADDSSEFVLGNGVRVRSKSEVIIAETLGRLKIPFRYEFPLQMKNGVCVHPDFLCLNVRTRKEIVWEHFGLMDELDYVGGFVLKMRTYSKNGFIMGDNLIFTMENKKMPLLLHDVERLAKTHLL